ncbi:MAG: 8-oxo-dGTP diphosphatase MutT [bacterium]
MSHSAPDNRLYVVVGILRDSVGRVLIQRRRPGTPKPGKWEFPGGKLENGEEPSQALSRELKEELGITVVTLKPLTAITHDYEHARVWLDTYLVTEFRGEPSGLEGQEIAWTNIDGVRDYDVLDAVSPIVQAILDS